MFSDLTVGELKKVLSHYQDDEKLQAVLSPGYSTGSSFQLLTVYPSRGPLQFITLAVENKDILDNVLRNRRAGDLHLQNDDKEE